MALGPGASKSFISIGSSCGSYRLHLRFRRRCLWRTFEPLGTLNCLGLEAPCVLIAAVPWMSMAFGNTVAVGTGLTEVRGLRLLERVAR